jgi:hypothetical protein
MACATPAHNSVKQSFGTIEASQDISSALGRNERAPRTAVKAAFYSLVVANGRWYFEAGYFRR